MGTRTRESTGPVHSNREPPAHRVRAPHAHADVCRAAASDRQELLRVAEDEAHELAKQKPGETDLLALNRLANTVARLAAADAALLARLGPRSDEGGSGEQPATGETVEQAAERILAEQWAQWECDLRESDGYTDEDFDRMRHRRNEDGYA